MAQPKNVFGSELAECGQSPVTGFYRDGCCRIGPGDVGLHLVCAEMTQEFLEFSAAKGNDLITPSPMMDFPGLKPGDRWCLCVERWKEALEAGVAPAGISRGHSHLHLGIRSFGRVAGARSRLGRGSGNPSRIRRPAPQAPRLKPCASSPAPQALRLKPRASSPAPQALRLKPCASSPAPQALLGRSSGRP